MSDSLDAGLLQLFGSTAPAIEDVELLASHAQAIERASKSCIRLQSDEKGKSGLTRQDEEHCAACLRVGLGRICRSMFFDNLDSKVAETFRIGFPGGLSDSSSHEEQDLAPPTALPVRPREQLQHTLYGLAQQLSMALHWLQTLEASKPELEDYIVHFQVVVQQQADRIFLDTLACHIRDVLWTSANSPLLPEDGDANMTDNDSAPPASPHARLQPDAYLFVMRARLVGLRLAMNNALDDALVGSVHFFTRAFAKDQEPSTLLEEYLNSFPSSSDTRRESGSVIAMSMACTDQFAELAGELRYYIAAQEGDEGYDLKADFRPGSAENLPARVLNPKKLSLLIAQEKTLTAAITYQELQKTYVTQFFECISSYPDMNSSLIDLATCVQETAQMTRVTKALNKTLEKRLLHPGAQTQDIIEFFVLLIHALRATQRNDVMLSRLAPPIRKYLCSRPDTVSVIVTSLLGNHKTFKLLRQELDRAKEIKTPFALEAIKITSSKSDEESSEEEAELDNLDWKPRPIDAGPNYRSTGRSDVISMLVSIFDDKDGFIAALERTMAEQLLRIEGYEHTDQYLSNLTLKNRFGEGHFSRIDNMISDVVASRRDDALSHDAWNKGQIPLLRSNAADTQPPPTDSSASVALAIHPLVISRHSWPEALTEAPPIGGTGLGTYSGMAAAPRGQQAPAHLRVPGGERPQHKLPIRFTEALDAYTANFKERKSTQTMRFLNGLGTMKLTLTMDDGRQMHFEDVTTLEAAVVEIASRKGSAAVLSAAEVVAELEVEKGAALNALYFWSANGVMRELGTEADTFQVIEQL